MEENVDGEWRAIDIDLSLVSNELGIEPIDPIDPIDDGPIPPATTDGP